MYLATYIMYLATRGRGDILLKVEQIILDNEEKTLKHFMQKLKALKWKNLKLYQQLRIKQKKSGLMKKLIKN